MNKRLKRQKNRGTTFTTVVLALLILVVSTLSNNITLMIKKYMSIFYSENVFTINANKLDLLQFPQGKKYDIYYPYLLEQDNMKIFYYAKEDASVLSGKGMLKYGTFPKTNDEVIVSYEYCQECFGSEFITETVIGKK